MAGFGGSARILSNSGLNRFAQLIGSQLSAYRFQSKNLSKCSSFFRVAENAESLYTNTVSPFEVTGEAEENGGN